MFKIPFFVDGILWIFSEFWGGGGGIFNISPNTAFRQVEILENDTLQKSLNAQNSIFHHPYSHSQELTIFSRNCKVQT